MGRKKIQIQQISNERHRQVTFTKRKFGLMKKAYELSILCDCEIGLIIFSANNKLFEYSSHGLSKVLKRHHEYRDARESHNNKDTEYFLSKKSKDAQSDDDSAFEGDEVPNLTSPGTDQRYQKVSKEFEEALGAKATTRSQLRYRETRSTNRGDNKERPTVSLEPLSANPRNSSSNPLPNNSSNSQTQKSAPSSAGNNSANSIKKPNLRVMIPDVDNSTSTLGNTIFAPPLPAMASTMTENHDNNNNTGAAATAPGSLSASSSSSSAGNAVAGAAAMLAIMSGTSGTSSEHSGFNHSNGSLSNLPMYSSAYPLNGQYPPLVAGTHSFMGYRPNLSSNGSRPGFSPATVNNIGFTFSPAAPNYPDVSFPSVDLPSPLLFQTTTPTGLASTPTGYGSFWPASSPRLSTNPSASTRSGEGGDFKAPSDIREPLNEENTLKRPLDEPEELGTKRLREEIAMTIKTESS